MRFRVAAACLVVCALALGNARAANIYRTGPVIVAHLDSGVFAGHREFDYRGPSSPDDQFVAWWDFTNASGHHVPDPGELWDMRRPDPYDDNGHGTGTASLAVGANREAPSVKYPSFAPGFKLAVAKVCTSDGKCPSNLEAEALDWAVDTVHADVITASISSVAPWPGQLDPLLAALKHAREAGALVVVANGNGAADAGIPEPGWTTSSADSVDVLSVGADDVNAYTINTDPEVTAVFSNVPMASNTCGGCYVNTKSGTSFGTPVVAGMAAAAMQAALDNGQDASPARIEQLLKYSARDTMTPPPFEGYGVLDAEQFPAAVQNAAAGTLPARPDQDLNAQYVDGLDMQERAAWSQTAGTDTLTLVPTGVAPATAPLDLGPAAESGAVEGERYVFHARAGQFVQVAVTFTSSWGDLRLYAGTGPTFTNEELAARGQSPCPDTGPACTITYRSPIDQDLTLVVVGRLALVDCPYAIAFGGDVPGAYAGQDIYLTDTSDFTS